MIDHNDRTVKTRKSDTELSPLKNDLIFEIESGEANLDDIVSYVSELEAFLADGRNTAHVAFYDATRHHELASELLEVKQREKQEQEQNKNNPYSFSRPPRLKKEELDEKLIALIEEKNYSEDELRTILSYIASDAGIHPLELRKVYDAKRLKLEREDSRRDTQRELNRLIKLEQTSLNIFSFFPAKIARHTQEFCEELDIRTEQAMLCILVTLSSCYPLTTRILLRKRSRYYEGGNLYGEIVAPPGSMKSAIKNVFATDPLTSLQDEFQMNFDREQSEHKRLEEEYKCLDKETRLHEFPEGLPTPPEKPNRAYITQTTVEAYAMRFSIYPDKRILVCCDELRRLFDSMNQYRGGKGGDEQAYLEMYDGQPIVSDRIKAESNYYVKKTCLSIYGATQPDKLQELWGDGRDSDGMHSRFLYVAQYGGCPEFGEEDQEYDCPVVEELNKLYYWAFLLKPETYVLSKAAYRRYIAFSNFLAKRSRQETTPFLQHTLSKARGHCGRLALNLHILSYFDGTLAPTPDLEVTEGTMDKAIKLTNYFLGQSEYLYKELCEQDTISHDLRAILQLSKRVGWVTAKDIKRNRRSLRDSDPNVIRECFQELFDMGKGELDGRGQKLRFKVFC